MNHQQPQYLESHPSQMSTGQPYAAQPSTSGGISQYPPYQQHPQQPPILQPGPANYGSSPASYAPQYGYAGGLTSPHGTGQPVSSSMPPHMNGLPPLPTMAAGAPTHTYVGATNGPPPPYSQAASDTTGQIAPSGMKPRVTATLWEDEGCMCFQVETNGICVARRDDNHMINGTKLLNVAGMTRGRRDGILKSEKTRSVVKIGPMHLKGVWIPFERALDFANKEKILDKLYPLFVHNIGALLYHPTNHNRTNAVMAATADRRKIDVTKQGGVPSATQPPSLTHHHSMNSSIGGQQPHSIAPHPTSGRPGLDRAHTFPTPPTSANATGAITGLNGQSGTYDWTNGSIGGGGVQGSQPLMMENHSHSTPATPATTPPVASLPTLQPYQSQLSYDNARPMYSTATAQHPQYASQQQSMIRSGSLQSNSYPKQEMGPPTARIPGSRPESEHGELKIDPYAQSQGNEHVNHGTGEEEADHEQDTDYPHDNGQSYAPQNGSYATYDPNYKLGTYNADQSHVASDMNGSSAVSNGSGRVTPRNGSVTQSPWTAGYQTPPRAPPSSNLYNPTSDARGTLPNGNSNTEAYMPGPYAPTQMNGNSNSLKRARDDDDHNSRPESRSDDIDAIKRRKQSTSHNGLVNGSFDNDSRSINRARSTVKTSSRR